MNFSAIQSGLKCSVLTIFFSASIYSTYAQTVGVGTTTPNGNAILDVTVPDPATTPQGMLFPRLTTAQRTALAGAMGAADEGMVVYDTDDVNIYKWDGTTWIAVGGTDSDWVSGGGFVYNTTDLIGIGTTTPVGPFHVAVDQDGTADSLFIVDAGANVGIGTIPSGTYKIEINGNIGTVGIDEISDRRWKKDITTLEGSLSNVMKLRGVNYNWRVDDYPNKNFTNKLQIGFIAQEVEKVFPELVTEDANGFKAVQYSKLVAVLTEAIQEQQDIIDAQNSRIDSLESNSARVEKLEGELEEIKRHLGIDVDVSTK